jgi:hypothetical protein
MMTKSGRVLILAVTIRYPRRIPHWSRKGKDLLPRALFHWLSAGISATIAPL